WRYTNLAPAIDVSNVWLHDAAAGTLEQEADERLQAFAERLSTQIDAWWIVIANGVAHDGSLTRLREMAPATLEVRAASACDSGRLNAADQPMTRFNTALLRDALRLEVRDGAKLEKPIGLLMIDSAATTSSVSQSRVFIDIGAKI